MNRAATIRRATPDDAPGLHRALRDLARHLGEEAKFQATPGDYLAHGFGDDPLFRALVAEQGREIRAAAIFFPEFSTQRGRPGVYLQDLWVAGASRGGGLGRRMLAAVFAEAGAWGAAYLRLSAHATNAAAVGFYERLGFVSDPQERAFVIAGEALARLEART